MKKTEIYCDRCGKLCEKSRNNRGFYIYKYILTKSTDYVDLCQNCYDGLAEWMKQGKERK